MAALVSVSQQRRESQGELRRFRNDLYDCFAARADVLFDVLDAVCTPTVVGGIAHLSLAGAVRRGHGGLYAAIADGRIDGEQVREVLAGYRPSRWPPDFAMDSTLWPRQDAHCSAGAGGCISILRGMSRVIWWRRAGVISGFTLAENQRVNPG